MDKLIEALKALNGDDKAKFAETVQREAPALYQSIFQAGHDVGYGKKSGELTTAQAKVAEIEGLLTTTKAELKTLKESPDSAAIHRSYEDRINTLTAQHQTELAKVQGLVIAEKQGRMASLLVGALTSGTKRLQGDYAGVLAEKSDVKNRIQVKADGTWAVLQKGKDIPFAAPTPEAAIAMLAEELKADAPAPFILAGTDAGGGTPANPGATGTPAPGSDVFSSIRENVKKAAEKTAGGDVKPHGSFAGLAQS